MTTSTNAIPKNVTNQFTIKNITVLYKWDDSQKGLVIINDKTKKELHLTWQRAKDMGKSTWEWIKEHASALKSFLGERYAAFMEWARALFSKSEKVEATAK